MKRYDVGDQVRITAEFRNLLGVLTNPTTVKFAHKSPLGVVVPFTFGVGVEIVNDAAGIYHFDLTFTSGNDTVPWWVRFEGTGAVVGAQEMSLFVRVPNVVIP